MKNTKRQLRSVRKVLRSNLKATVERRARRARAASGVRRVTPRTPEDVVAQHTAKREAKAAETERKAIEAKLLELTARASVVSEIRRLASIPAPKARPGRVLSGDKREAAAVAVLSDWHVEERVDPAKVMGLNEYNPTIAEHRAQRCFAAIEWLIREQQSLFTIRTLVLAILGDIITGYIHEELVESNHMSPTRAVVFAKRLLADGIRMLLKAAPELKIHFVCKGGNHGRTTPKLRIATAMDNSYEWLLYHMLAEDFADEERVTFQIDEGHHSVTPIYGLRVHTHHGDSVRSQGGIGGITVPLNRAAIQWREKYHADLSLVGHFHQLHFGQKLIVNGSLVGYGAYSDFLPSAQPEPAQQAFFLVDSKRGVCQLTPIWCAK